MQLRRHTLTPQMRQYDDFDDRGATRHLPYLMQFHRADYRSDVVNTDVLGFRLTDNGDRRISAGTDLPAGPVRVFAGSSTAFGIGASSDADTIPSLLWAKSETSVPWLNFGGRSYNSAQELMLFMLHRHLVRQVDEIVLFSGFNTLALSRLPRWQHGDHGAFFFCGEYFAQMSELRARHRKPKRAFGRRDTGAGQEALDTSMLSIDEQIRHSVDLTARHLAGWRDLAAATGARLSYVLQPLATWVRDEPAPQERTLFAELDKLSNMGIFQEYFGDIVTMEVGRRYGAELGVASARLGVPFLDLNPVLAGATTTDDWLYVDRAHLTDLGHDLVAGLLAEHLSLS